MLNRKLNITYAYGIILTALSASLSFLTQSLMAQQRPVCGHTHYQEHLYKKYPSYRSQIRNLENALLNRKLNQLKGREKQMDTLTIPIVVHIISGNQSVKISDEMVAKQIRVLNEDYQRTNKDTVRTPKYFKALASGIPIKFVLANRDSIGRFSNGVERRNISGPGFLSIVEDGFIKSSSYWPSDSYLNIWIVRFIDEENPVLGYAEFPFVSSLMGLEYEVPAQLDGVVLDERAFGYLQNQSIYNLGRTLTHEIGHWLGLIHIWGDSFCGDDYVDDTPIQDSSNIRLRPSYCFDSSDCTGIKLPSMANNYMDYSADACMNMFTKGQVERMQAVISLANRRNQLYQSRGYYKPKYWTDLPWYLDLTNGKIPSLDTAKLNQKSSMKWEIQLNSESNFMNHTSSLANKGDTLIYASPFINFTKYKNPVLSFEYLYNNIITEQNDSLEIGFMPYDDRFISINKIKLSDTVISNNWQKLSIDLAKYVGLYEARLAIRIVSSGNTSLSIRELNCINFEPSFEIKLYPNPSYESINIVLPQKIDEAVEVEMINYFGTIISKWTIPQGLESLTINKSEFNAGVYFFKYKYPKAGFNKTVKLIFQ